MSLPTVSKQELDYMTPGESVVFLMDSVRAPKDVHNHARSLPYRFTTSICALVKPDLTSERVLVVTCEEA